MFKKANAFQSDIMVWIFCHPRRGHFKGLNQKLRTFQEPRKDV